MKGLVLLPFVSLFAVSSASSRPDAVHPYHSLYRLFPSSSFQLPVPTSLIPSLIVLFFVTSDLSAAAAAASFVVEPYRAIPLQASLFSHVPCHSPSHIPPQPILLSRRFPIHSSISTPSTCFASDVLTPSQLQLSSTYFSLTTHKHIRNSLPSLFMTPFLPGDGLSSLIFLGHKYPPSLSS